MFGIAFPVVRSSGFWGLVLAVATWPFAVSRLGAGAGLDNSWQAALAMDAHLGIPFGTRAVYTYGPLGFLTTPNVLLYPGLTLWATLFQVAMATAFYGLLIYALRRLTWAPAAVALAAIAGTPAVVNWIGDEPLIGVGLFISLQLLRRDPDHPASDLWWAGLGFLVGVTSLAKASGAIDIGVVALLAVLVAPRRHRYRSTAISVASCIAVFAIGWFGTGNGFGNLVAFARGDASITGGYSAAMYSSAFFVPTYQYWLFGLSVAGVGFLAWASHPPVGLPGARWRDWHAWRPVARCVASGLAITITVFVLFKAGVVRQGLREYFINLPLMVAAVVTLPLTRLRRVPDRTALVGGVVAAAMCGYVTTSVVPAQLFSPVGDGLNLAREVHALVTPEGDRLVSQDRVALRTYYALPPAMLSAVSGSTVDIEPWEQEVAHAYPEMRWDPLPVIQDYAAYTTYLDQLDGRFLASTAAPRFIIRQMESMDYRVLQFDPPATQIAVECRYHQVQVSSSWQLLERGRDRCGKPTPLATVSAGFGHSINVPTASRGRIVAAEFSIHQSVSWRLLNAFFRPPAVDVFLNAAPSQPPATPPWNRFLVGTASDLHLLSAPTALGYGSSFAPVNIRSLTLSVEHQPPTSSGIMVRFYAIPFH